MKPLYILPILFGLCACSDKPVFVQNDLWCVSHDNGAREKANIDVKLYENYAIISVDGQQKTLEKKYVREEDNFKSVQYEADKTTLIFNLNVFQDDTKISLILNGKACLFPETVNSVGTKSSWPYNRYQTKEIDRKTQRKIQKLFENPEWNFHETDIECLNVTCVNEECSNVWDKYKSLDVDSEKAVLKTNDRTIIFKLYTQDATEETMAVYDDEGIYKNETDEQPMFLHFVDNDTYSLGTNLNYWSQCRKARK
ncbi:MAG: hypothetical protein J5714_05175 [Alphaproteobacteria bacterium]|nr:hypothetical protein [Alphaproteobacteria bacterium]